MKIVIIFFVLFFGPIVSADALDVPRFQGYVNDYANMISADAKVLMEEKLKTLEQSDSTQIYVLTVPSLEGEVIEEFAIKVFDEWKAGQKQLDNGVILIVAQKERKIRIEVGRGLEGQLTDLEAGRIIDLVMKPRFRDGDYNGGFIEGVSSLVQTTKGQFRTGERDNIPDDGNMPMGVKFIGIVMKRPENFMELVAGFGVLLIGLALLSLLKIIKKKSIIIAAGAAALPVIAFFTVWDPKTGMLLMKDSLFALLFYIVTGGVTGAFASFVSPDGGGSGGGYSGGSSGGSSSGSSSSGGGGGSSGGGGASGDY